MSINEFLDGLPSYDERSFTSFHTNNQWKKAPVYVSTVEQSTSQLIKNKDNKMVFSFMQNNNNGQHGLKRRHEDDAMSNEPTASSSKRQLMEE